MFIHRTPTGQVRSNLVVRAVVGAVAACVATVPLTQATASPAPSSTTVRSVDGGGSDGRTLANLMVIPLHNWVG